MTDQEIYDLLRKEWPSIDAAIKEAIDGIQDSLEGMGMESDDAFRFINLLLLREIFFRKTILQCINRDKAEHIPDWIEKIYNEWDEEAA